MNTLDASFIDNNGQQYDDKQFVYEIKDKLQQILHREFPDSRIKQQIKTDSSGLNFACPYCHDSATNTSKKRGHLIFKGKWAGHYKCFNCGHFTSIDKFMHDFDQDLTLSGIKFVEEHKQNMSMQYRTESAELTADVFQKDLAEKYGLNREAFRDYMGLSEIDTSYRGINGYNYLTSRMQYNFRNFLFDYRTNSVVILNLCDNKIIGCQIRRIGRNVPKDKRFLTYTLDRIYKYILKQPNINVPEELNTISTLFNIYSVDVYKPIIVTEGPMDAFLLPNAIATSGANKKMAIELPFYYLFDADTTGNKRAIEKLRTHSNVFMWGKLKKDLGLPRRHKWDINDVVLWCRDNKPFGFKIQWLNYFTDNILDMIYLDDLTMAI